MHPRFRFVITRIINRKTGVKIRIIIVFSHGCTGAVLFAEAKYICQNFNIKGV